jgi:hypothetical protein
MTTGQPHPHRRPDLRHPQITGSVQPNPTGDGGPAKTHQEVQDARKAGHVYVVLDGTLVPIDRVAVDRPFYSGKHQPAESGNPTPAGRVRRTR